MAKFNVALGYFCGRPIGTLVDSMRKNPDVRATGDAVLGSVQQNPDVDPSKVSLPMWHLGPNLSRSSFGPPESTTQTASRLAQPFLQGSRPWQTDRLTDETDRPSVATGRSYIVLRCGLIIPDIKSFLGSGLGLWLGYTNNVHLSM